MFDRFPADALRPGSSGCDSQPAALLRGFPRVWGAGSEGVWQPAALLLGFPRVWGAGSEGVWQPAALLRGFSRVWGAGSMGSFSARWTEGWARDRRGPLAPGEGRGATAVPVVLGCCQR